MTVRVFVLLVVLAGCGRKDEERAPAAVAKGPHPDELPVMLNSEPPFRYPPSLYDRKIQANVLLRLYIDINGTVRPESTVIAQSSGYALLDTAAIRGAEELRFVPAKTNGAAQGASVFFPVYFRHPEARALPGDTILHR